MKYWLTVQLLVFTMSYTICQNLATHSIRQAMAQGMCFKATIEVDKSTILENNNRQSFLGELEQGNGELAFQISANPYGQTNAYNSLSIKAFIRNGNYEEIVLTYQGNTDVYKPDRIKAYQDNFGFHYELGSQNTNILQNIVKTDMVKIHMSAMTCGTNIGMDNSSPIPQSNPTEGCADLHDVIEDISNKMYKWPDEDKGKAWASGQTRKIYELPGGCVGRSKEVNKLFVASASVYPKWNEEDERYAWFKARLDESFARPCNYLQDNLGDEIDELLSEAETIFKWNQKDEKRAWLTKKIIQLLK